MSDVMDPLQFQEETQDILAGVSRQSSLQLTPAPPPPTTNEGTRLILREPSVGSTALDRRHIRDLISRSPDPDAETDKIMSSLYMAQITPHSPSYIYRNFDEVNEQFWGQVYKRNTRDIFRVAYNNASVDIEIGKVMAQAITRPDDEINEYLQEAARLEQFKSEEFTQDYSFAQKIVEATGQFLPYYVNPVVELAPIVGSAALIGGLAATGAGVGAGAVLASAGSAGRTVMTVGSTPSIGRVMAGLSFYHMAMTEDEDGNGIPLNIARGHAMWSGILQGALGAMQFRTITKGATMANLWRQSVLTTAKKGLITGRPAAIGIGFLKNYGATLAEGVVEEVLQESVGYWMHQSAIEFANKTTEANIERGNWGEFLEMVGETAVRTTMGLSILSGLGAARGTWRSVRSQASIDARAFTSIQAVEQAVGKENVTAEIINAIAEGDRESALTQISNVIRDNPMPKDIGVTKTDTGSYVASAGEQNIMTMDVSVEDGAATLSTSEVAPEITNRYGQTQIDRMMLNSIDAMVTRFAQDNPGMTLEFDRNDANQSLIKEAIENQDPNMRTVNQIVRSENAIIQGLETEIQNVQRQIESVQEAVVTEQMTEEEITAQQEEVAQMSLEQQQRIADLEAEILDHQAILQRVIDYKSAYETKYFDRQDVTNKPSEQVVVAEQQALEATVTVDTEFVVNEYLHKQFPNASDGEVNMMQLLLELEAERKGVTLPQLMETDYEASLSIMAGEAVDAEFAARGLANPASTVFSDSQRLMKFSTEATFSDFFHEWVHISVSNLSQQQLQVLADFTGEQTTQWETWSSDSHEQVVSAIFQVVKGTQEFTGRLAQVLEYIKTTFKRAAELLIKTKEINPEVENVLRAIIAEPATEATQAVVSDVTIGNRLSTDMMLDRVRQSQDAFRSNMEQRSQQMAQEQQQALQAIENNILQVVEPDGFIEYSNLDAFARQNQMSITDAASILENIINRQSERGDADSRAAQQKSLESLEKIRRESTLELFAPPSPLPSIFLPDPSFFRYQDANMEATHKSLFNTPDQNYVYVEKVENAGDIGRELAMSATFIDRNYIGEKLRKIQKLIDPNRDPAIAREFYEQAADSETESRVMQQYKDQYNAFPGNLGVLGQLSKDLSMAVINRDRAAIADAWFNFVFEYEKALQRGVEGRIRGGDFERFTLDPRGNASQQFLDLYNNWSEREARELAITREAAEIQAEEAARQAQETRQDILRGLRDDPVERYVFETLGKDYDALLEERRTAFQEGREPNLELFAPPSIEDQRQRISESIDRFEAVSDKQLRKYANDPEIGDKVRQEIQRREADNVLINESVEANRESIQGMSQSEAIDFMTTFSDATPELARRVWNEINVFDINQGNTLWFNSLANMDIQRIVDNAKDVLLDIGPLAQTWTPNGGQHDKSVRTWIRNNATKMRRALAYDIPVYEAGGDVSRADIDIQALTQLNRELIRSDVRDLSSLQNPYAIDVDALRTVLRQEGRALLAENITDGYFADVLKATSQRLSQLDADLTVEIDRVQGFVNNIRTMIPSRISVRDPAANFNSLLIKLQRNLQDGGNLDGSFRIASQEISNQIREATGQVIDLTKLNRLLTQRIENQKRREVVRKERQKMKKMVKSMQRAANFNSIHINQRSQIEALVSGIDPEFRTRKTEARLREVTESMGDDPMTFTQLDSRTRNMLGKSNLNEFSFQQIQELYERVKALTEEGREAMRVQREAMESARKRVLQGLVDDMRTDIQPPDVAPPEPGTRPRGTFLQQLRDVSLSTLDIARLADMLDGRQGFRGKNHNFFVTQVLNAEANMYQAMDARDTWMVDRLKELGYDVNKKNYRRTLVDLLSQDTDSQGNTFTIDGVNYSLDAVLEMYAGFKNAKKHAAIVLGNGRDRILSLIEQGVNDRQAMEIVNAEFQGLVDRLTPEQRRLGDLIIDEYAQHYDRIAETYGRYHNAILGSEESYTPIVVRGFTSLKHEAQMAKEILISHNYRRAGLDRKFTIDRLENIPLNSRRPIELGLFRNWEQSSLAQENFIAYSEWNYLANGIFSTAQVGEAFRDKVTRQRADGEAMMNQLKDYHKRVLTRQELLENTPINKMISGLRRRTSQAYLAFNAITVMKQAPSIAFYMVEANPTDIFQSIGKYMQNPSQFIAETEGRNPIPRQAIREFAMIEQYMANPDINIGMRRLTEYGMAMIKIVDNAVTRIGEDAVYTKALRDGVSPQEAIQRAREVTMRTQPAGRPKDMSKIFNIESMYLLTQFSQQLNKVWQMMTYDIPQAYAPQQYRSQQLNTVVAMMISSYFIWALNNRQVMPDVEEPSDFVDLMLTQTLASVPVVGSAITQARQGFTSEPAIITPFTRSVDLVNQIQRAMDPERELTDAQRDRLVRTILEAFALGAGLPAVAPSRIIKASQYFRDSEDFTDTLSTALTGGVWTMRGEE